MKGNNESKLKFTQVREEIKTALESVDEELIGKLIDQIWTTITNRKRIFLIGNGGSSATCDHFANDLTLLGIRNETIIDCRSLSSNNALLTCVANDYGYEHVFSKQLETICQNGDLLICFSASGNSKNLINACQVVKMKGALVASVLGFDGGELKERSDISIHFKTLLGNYGVAEDSHLILCHYLSRKLQEMFN